MSCAITKSLCLGAWKDLKHDLVICCHHLEIPNEFWRRSPIFYSSLYPVNYISTPDSQHQFWLDCSGCTIKTSYSSFWLWFFLRRGWPPALLILSSSVLQKFSSWQGMFEAPSLHLAPIPKHSKLRILGSSNLHPSFHVGLRSYAERDKWRRPEMSLPFLPPQSRVLLEMGVLQE